MDELTQLSRGSSTRRKPEEHDQNVHDTDTVRIYKTTSKYGKVTSTVCTKMVV